MPDAADLLIVGGGPIGMTAAAAFAHYGLEVTVIERADPKTRTGHARNRPVDGRTTALSHASVELMRGVGLWEGLAEWASPILDIRVSDGESPLFVHYDHAEIGDAPLGFIIENERLWTGLYEAVGARENVRYLAPATIRSVSRDGTCAAVTRARGPRLAAPLMLACDGRNSALRRQANISVAQWSYAQTAIVLTVAHEDPHGHIAHERFLPAGPFAILPMTDDQEGRHRSSVVWTERADLAPALLALPNDEFLAELEWRFGDFLGGLEVIGERWSYPLNFLNAARYTDTRLALVGDAGHAMHPIAGQGLNMGIRDIAALCELVVEAKRRGQDIGSETVLERYERWRRFDNTTLMYITDGLNRLFSNNSVALRAARDIGLGLVNRTPPLRRFFMRHAMGLAGDLPKLLVGERI